MAKQSNSDNLSNLKPCEMSRLEQFRLVGELLGNLMFESYREFMEWLAEQEFSFSRMDELIVYNYCVSHGKIRGNYAS